MCILSIKFIIIPALSTAMPEDAEPFNLPDANIIIAHITAIATKDAIVISSGWFCNMPNAAPVLWISYNEIIPFPHFPVGDWLQAINTIVSIP